MFSFLTRIIVAVTLVLPAGAFAATIQLPETGQTQCYDAGGGFIACDSEAAAGQDGNVHTGVAWPAPRFVEPVPAKGVLIDKLTDLVWLKNADCLEGIKPWQDALDRAKTLADGACGLSDGSVAGQWRLPSRKELLSLSNFQQRDGGAWLASQGFVNSSHGYYWSSDSYVITPVFKWVYHSEGDIRADIEGEIQFRALYVRDGTSIALSPASHDYGNVGVGNSKTFSFTIKNAGKGILSPSGASITGTDSAEFSVNPGDGSGTTCGPAAVLAPAGECTIAVTFSPASLGAKEATLRITSNADDLPVVEAALSGAGVPASTVTASVDGGNGSITSANPVIVETGSPASFTVEPAAGYGIGPVGGTCPAGSFYGATYTTGAVTADCSVTFSFTPNSFTINTVSGDGGSIACTPAATVLLNTVVSCTATPGEGRHIASVTVDGVSQTVSGQGAFTFPFGAVSANHTMSATFAINTYQVRFSAQGNGSISGETTQTVSYGGSTTPVTAEAASGSHFVNWSGTGGFTSTSNPVVVTNVTADREITANFSSSSSSVVTPVSDEHGTISPDTPQTPDQNGVTTFFIKPAPGYHIASVTGCGGTLNGMTYTTAPGATNCTVTAQFEPDTIQDALKAFRFVIGKIELTDEERYSYDVAPLGDDWKPRPDGIVDMADVVIMLRRLVGLLSW